MNTFFYTRRILYSAAILFTVIALFLFTNANLYAFAPLEEITHLDSTVTVNTDNSVTVQETINYDTGPLERHGIYRDIRTLSARNLKMNIDVISVTDQNNATYQFTTSDIGNNVYRIKIGNPDVTFNGDKVYKITYRAKNAISHFNTFDEIYWNVTGTEWAIPIQSVSAHIILPSGISSTQSSCYVGYVGANSLCAGFTDKDVDFVQSETLSPGNGITIAVGFPVGVVKPYSFFDKVLLFISSSYEIVFSLAFFLITCVYMFIRWNKYGKDPTGTGVIVAQYDVPDGLLPVEVSGLMKDSVDVKSISAQLIQLAISGYIKITQIENETLGIFKSKEYEITLLKSFNDLKSFDQDLLVEIFKDPTVGSVVAMSSLKNSFYKQIPEINKSVMIELKERGYFTEIKEKPTKPNYWFVLWIIVFVCAWIFKYHIAVISLMISFIVYAVFQRYMSAHSPKGVATKEYLLGFKEYLQIAEKDRLAFHNAPEKKPETFERFLPFAMAFGVEKAWAKEFEGVYTTPPTWYVGSTQGNFNALSFTNEIRGFQSAALATMGSGSSGSGGGGGVGGGGGGGGGGGW